MQKWLFAGFLLLVAAGACKKSETPGGGGGGAVTIDCAGVTPTYSMQVQPLMANFCSSGSGCHGAGSSQGPGALVNHTQVFSNRAAIRSSVLNGTMPKGTTLTGAQKAQIVCWIDQGAANN